MTLLSKQETLAEFTEHMFTTRDGLALEYRLYEPRNLRFEAPILCLHGLTRNLRDFEELAPLLAESGRRVYCISQRGRGRSDYETDPSRYVPSIYSDDVIAFLDTHQIEQAILFGSSMGGIMSMQIAHRAKQRVRAVVLNDIGPVLSPEGIARIMGYVGEQSTLSSWDEAAVACQAVNGDAFPHHQDKAFWLIFAKRICHQKTDGSIVYSYDKNIAVPTKSEHADIPTYWEEFKSLVGIPLLSVRGALSDLLSATTVSEMKIAYPDMRIAIVPNIGHVPFLTEPAALEAIKSFLMDIEKVETKGAPFEV